MCVTCVDELKLLDGLGASTVNSLFHFILKLKPHVETYYLNIRLEATSLSNKNQSVMSLTQEKGIWYVLNAESLVSAIHHHCLLNITEIKHPDVTLASDQITPTRCQDTSRSVSQHDKKKRRKKTHSALFHGPVWITLNSFIWNIKTMKHKPSTKSDSYKCRAVQLLKMNRSYWKTSRLYFLNGEADTQSRQVRCEHDYAIYMLQILPDSRRRNGKDKKGNKKKQKKKRKQRYSSDNSSVSLWQSGCGPGFKRAFVIGQNE